MSMIDNKIKWCLKKAERELSEGIKHRGLIKIKPDIGKAKEHIRKAEHYLKATLYLKRGNFSDLTASTLFYTMYHSLLAIIVRYGYESRNQECTFALVYYLIEKENINFDKLLIDKIISLNPRDLHSEKTSVEIREEYQYGTKLSLRDDVYNELLDMAKKILLQAQVIIEE